MAQVDKINYIPLLFWFIILILLFYVITFTFIIPMLYNALKVRQLFFLELIAAIKNKFLFNQFICWLYFQWHQKIISNFKFFINIPKFFINKIKINEFFGRILSCIILTPEIPWIEGFPREISGILKRWLDNIFTMQIEVKSYLDYILFYIDPSLLGALIGLGIGLCGIGVGIALLLEVLRREKEAKVAEEAKKKAVSPSPEPQKEAESKVDKNTK